MTATLFFDPRSRPLSLSGTIMPGAYYTFYDADTDELTPAYADADLNVELANPLEADSDGRFPVIYMDAAVTYRITLHNSSDVLQYDCDPYMPPRDHPPGTVVFFYGTSMQRDAAYPPTLWQQLDGTNSTPDGRGRAVVIAGAGISVGDLGGAASDSITTSSESSHTHAGGVTGSTALTVSQLPAHYHRTKGNYVSGGYDGGGNQFYRARTSDSVQNSAGDFMENTGSGDGHTHTGGTTGAGSAHSHTATVDTISPYVALWALMRKYP